MTTERRPARGQNLPGHEVTLLQTLTGKALHERAAVLYAQGWTLDSIGRALNPPRPRSTVRVWVTAQQNSPATLPTSQPAPSPVIPARALRAPRPKRVSPGIPPETSERIAALAPIARRYRARVSPASQPAIANAELTRLCTTLYASGVTIRELANAANVTYRAMARRLGRVTAKKKGNASRP